MAVSELLICFQEFLQPVPLELQSYYPIMRFTGDKAATGDASGGSVSCAFMIKTTGAIDNYYWVITNLNAFTDDTTANNFVYVEQHAYHWKTLGTSGLNRYPWHAPFDTTADVVSINARDLLQKPIFLGKSTDVGSGTINMVINTNTNTKTYTFSIDGYAFARPPLTSKIPIM